MKKKITIIALLIISCQNGIDINTTKQAITDSIADITYLNGSFFTTNLDKSGNAGPQIDLYKFDESILINQYPMELNGQGYMATANDGSNLYFQPRFTDYIFKINPVGNIFWYQSDNFPDNTSDTTSTFMYWNGWGLAWADTNLVALYRHTDDSTRYRARYIHINNSSFQSIIDTTVIWGHLNNSGAYAMEYNTGTKGFWVLATDSLSQYILFEVDSSFVYSGSFDVINGNPMGISIGPDSGLYLSYPRKQIERLVD